MLQISFADFLRLDPLEIEERQAAAPAAVPAAPMRPFGPLRHLQMPAQRAPVRNRFAQPARAAGRTGVDRVAEPKADNAIEMKIDDIFNIDGPTMEQFMKGLVPPPLPKLRPTPLRFPTGNETIGLPVKEMNISDYRTSLLPHGRADHNDDQEHNSLDAKVNSNFAENNSIDDGPVKGPHTQRERFDMNSYRSKAEVSTDTKEFTEYGDLHSHYGGSKMKEREMFSRQYKSESPSTSSASSDAAFSKMLNAMNIDNESPTETELAARQSFFMYCMDGNNDGTQIAGTGTGAGAGTGTASTVNTTESDAPEVGGRVYPDDGHGRYAVSSTGHRNHFDEWSENENDNENENENDNDNDYYADEVEGEPDEIDAAIVEELNGMINGHEDAFHEDAAHDAAHAREAEIEIHIVLDEIFGVRPNHPW
jgi:hypothetical protein